VDTTKTTTHLGLCAGYGGIELGLKRVIPNLRSVALCEIEAFACANLVSKMEAGLMEPAPIWTDLKTFPWESFRDRVDILTGGYPCQPFSAAGKRLGTEDPRHLWPFIASGIRILQPRMCYFENVEGHISLGLREVIADLGAIGYQTAWGIFSAREVGAPHQRKRVFILAVSNSLGGATGLSRSLAWNEGVAGVSDNGGSEGCGELADDTGERLSLSYGQRNEPEGQRDAEFECCGHNAWPSRPGEPQHGWEPPRVVGSVPAKLANFCSRDAQQGGDTSQTSGEGFGAWGESAHAMPNGGSSVCRGDTGDESQARVVANSNSTQPSEGRGNNGEVPQVPAGEWTDECAALSGGEGEPRGEVMENSKLVGRRGRCDGDAGGLRGEIQTEGSCGGGTEVLGNADHGRLASGLDAGSGTEADRGGQSDIEQAEPRQTEPALGRDADGAAGGLDYAELQVSCDNRTDELRLLGNGVVPATAERAFRTLLEELNA